MNKFKFVVASDAALAETDGALRAAQDAFNTSAARRGMVLAQIKKLPTGELEIQGAFVPHEFAKRIQSAMKDYVESVAPPIFGSELR